MPNIILKTEGLTKSYGPLVAVKNLSLEICEGEIFGFLGPNGAGKTTSINMMCGLLKPDLGRVLVKGVPISNGNLEARTRVGVCPQNIVLWERLTCLEQLKFIGQMYNVPSSEAHKRAERLLEELDLTDKRNEQARTLSGGMQRRLNLAMALVHDPEIVVMDEPEAGLDPQSRVKVREYTRSLARKKTVILTTHNMDEADRMADRIAIIDHGELLVTDTPEALKKSVGEGDVLEIELKEKDGTANPEPAVRNALAGLSVQTSFDSGRKVLVVRALNAMGMLPTILERLSKANFHVGEARLRENTLEDVFIRLTGRGLRE